MAYSWARKGERKKVRHEDTKGRRVNALAAYTFRAAGPPSLEFEAKPRSLTSGDLLSFLRGLPDLGVPRVVVLDNATIHKSNQVKAALPELRSLGIYLYRIPPYSPRLNRIEGVFRQIKYQGLPTRAYRTEQALLEAVEQGLRDYATALAARTTSQPRPSA